MKWVKSNGLTLTFFFLFLITLVGQTFTGLAEYNKELADENAAPVGLTQYLTSGHFLEVTFENWESEFLQMGLFVLFTIFLYQKGSSESKDPQKFEEVDREPDPKREGAPWPVKKGGFALALYKHSLTLAFLLLFLLTFIGHWYGSLKGHNTSQALKGLPLDSAWSYLGTSKFWFESFQNWQSEFLSVFSVVLFSVFLRQKGSSQSKPVDAANDETGD